jgi:hypothetical protein
MKCINFINLNKTLLLLTKLLLFFSDTQTMSNYTLSAEMPNCSVMSENCSFNMKKDGIYMDDPNSILDPVAINPGLVIAYIIF